MEKKKTKIYTYSKRLIAIAVCSQIEGVKPSFAYLLNLRGGVKW